MQKVIIDTDPGDDIDDLLALAFALLRPELQILAITTVTYQAALRAHLVRKLLCLLGKENIPVGVGMDLPLRFFSEAEEKNYLNFALRCNHYGFVKPEEVASLTPQPEIDAIDLIIHTVEKNPGEVIFVGIGPQTNLAVALRKRPEIMRKLKGLAFMGGELALDRREHNVFWDYYASHIVTKTGRRAFWGTWDVTRRFIIGPADRKRIAEHKSPLTDALTECLDLWWETGRGSKPGAVMYDLSPVIWAYDKSFHATEAMRVGLDLNDGPTFGRLIRLESGEVNADVTVDIDEARIREVYFETIFGTGTTGS